LLTVLGGAKGKLHARSMKSQGLSVHIVPVQSETRTCQTLLSGGVATELVEETKSLTKVEIGDVRRAFRHEIGAAKIVALTGTVPPSCGEDFYAELVAHARRLGVAVLVDAQGEQLRNAINKKPFLVRINRTELAALSGRRQALSDADVYREARRLIQRGVEWVVVSHGAKETLAVTEGAAWIFAPPAVAAVNPIGSGDAMLAGIVCGLWRGQSVADAIRLGVACGCANALTLTAGGGSAVAR
jgi:tagatose 6-phosphate kinase